MTVSISLGIIGLFKLSGLDLILVSGVSPENCPFPLNFPVLWSTGFEEYPNDSLHFLSVCCYFSFFISDFGKLNILFLCLLGCLDKGLFILLILLKNQLLEYQYSSDCST